MEGMESPHKRRRLSPSASPAIASPKHTTLPELSAPNKIALKDEGPANALMESIDGSTSLGLTSKDEFKDPSGAISLPDISSSAPDPSSAVSQKNDDRNLNKFGSVEPPIDDDDPLAEIDFSLLSHTPNVDTQTNLALFDPSSMILDFSSLDQSFLFDLPAELESALSHTTNNEQLDKTSIVGGTTGIVDDGKIRKFLGIENDAAGFLGGMASVSATPLGSPDLKALAESLVQDSPAISPESLAFDKAGLISISQEQEGPSVLSDIDQAVPSVPSLTGTLPSNSKEMPTTKSPIVKTSRSVSPHSAVSPSATVPGRTSTPVAAVVTIDSTLSSDHKPKSISSPPTHPTSSVSSSSVNNTTPSTLTTTQASLPSKQSPTLRAVPPTTTVKSSLASSRSSPVIKKPVMTKYNSMPVSIPPTTRPSIPASTRDDKSTKSRTTPIAIPDDITLDPNALPPELMSFDFAALEASVLAGMAPSEPLTGATVTSSPFNTTSSTTTTITDSTAPPLASSSRSLPSVPTLASTSSNTPTLGSTHTSSSASGPVQISRPTIPQASKINQPTGARSQTTPVPTLRTMNPAAYGRPPAQTVNLNTVLTGINSLLASPSVGQASAFSTVNPDMSTPGSMWSVEDRRHYLSLLPSSSLVQIILKLTETHPGLLAYPRALSDVVLQLEVQALKPKSGPQGGVGIGHRVGMAQSSVGTVGGQPQKYAVRPGIQPGQQANGVQGRPALYHPPGVRPAGVRPGVRPVVGGARPITISNGNGVGSSARPSASPLTPAARPRPINSISNSSIGRSPNSNPSSPLNHNSPIRPSSLPHTIPKLAALHTSSPPSAGGGTISVRPKGAGVSSPLGRPPNFNQNQGQAQGQGQGLGAAALHAAQAQAGMAALMSQLLPSRTPSPATGPTTNGGRTVNGSGATPKGST